MTEDLQATGDSERDTLPVKSREINCHSMDSRIWNDVKLRSDDIVICTYSKSGTTWVQQIVAQLIFKGDPAIAVGAMSPWVDCRPVPREVMLGVLEAQTHRRFLKTHLPRNAMRWDPAVKYIFIGRDGRDTIWSSHNHFTAATPAFYDLMNAGDFEGPSLKRPSGDPRDLFLELLKDDPDTSTLWPFWSHIRSWWEARNQPNILMVHFNDLKMDLEGQMKRIGHFLDIPDLPEEEWKAAVQHCTFDWMKEHAELAAPPQASIAWVDGAQSFIYKGTNSRWKDRLSEEDIRLYEQKARAEVGDDCARWLHHGSL